MIVIRQINYSPFIQSNMKIKNGNIYSRLNLIQLILKLTFGLCVGHFKPYVSFECV